MTTSYSFTDYVRLLSSEHAWPLLHAYQTGLEREGLRVLSNGQLSPHPHPMLAGSALTHPYITTDFSEAQVELVSPPCQSIPALSQTMANIHAFMAKQMGEEWLWPYSMPMRITDDGDIPIAYFGTSPQGQMKALYRKGLARRYRKKMQIISGIHFNFSFTPGFWDYWYQLHQTQENQTEFTNVCYFNMMRNFLRYCWLLTYLFGVSPIVDQTFLDKKPPELEAWDHESMYGPYATSLRMSQVGYVSNRRCKFGVSYNQLSDYIRDIYHAVTTSCSDFTALGVKNVDGYQQLNDHILQIENEHYSLIRAKQPLKQDERPLTALYRRGVSYIEVRGVDLNPFEPTGVAETQLRFLHLFLLYMLMLPSPPMDAAEEKINRANQAEVALLGRKPELKLSHGNETVVLSDWAQAMLHDLTPLADLLDQDLAVPVYQPVLAAQQMKIKDPEQTPSAHLLHTLKTKHMTLQDWNLQQAHLYHQQWNEMVLPQDFIQVMKLQRQQSLQAQETLETSHQLNLSSYLADYEDLLDEIHLHVSGHS